MIKGKTFLIISPQQWEGLWLSKHHIACQLAKMGANVFFLAGPRGTGQGITINKTTEGVHVIHHGHWFSSKLFFHFRKLYFFLLKFHVNTVLKKIGKIDIVWSFDAHRYIYLDWFKEKAEHVIFHPADIQFDKYFTYPAKSADIIVGVSEPILAAFPDTKKKIKVGHGVTSDFLALYDTSYQMNTAALNFCYAGNITLKGVDTKAIQDVIRNHPSIIFHMIGPCNIKDKEDETYVHFLKNQLNVQLYGLKKPEEMREVFSKMDGFFLCYDKVKEQNGGSNSHKILEYMATGKVVISSVIDEYVDKPGLIEMNPHINFTELFSKVIENISFYNNSEEMKRRHMYAESRSYENLLKEVLALI